MLKVSKRIIRTAAPCLKSPSVLSAQQHCKNSGDLSGFLVVAEQLSIGPVAKLQHKPEQPPLHPPYSSRLHTGPRAWCKYSGSDQELLKVGLQVNS